ncbi:hypothetical protein [Lacrimispora indolis]|uniref:hypothetical protein n=1 Tax=Lacrimispora indolis TaxID=69825 RepID=UPI00045EBE93|nr:hypothetical protein [Lacrimispora indolis]MBE7718417.1 hypothetical protein [Lacrimispora celerecrescens]
MSKTIKSGGVGKSPAIEKINRLNAISSQLDAAAMLEQKVFRSEQDKAQQSLKNRKQIINDFAISFQEKNE